MNLAVNRILYGGAWDEIDKTTLRSFEENDEKLINRLFLQIFVFPNICRANILFHC